MRAAYVFLIGALIAAPVAAWSDAPWRSIRPMPRQTPEALVLSTILKDQSVAKSGANTGTNSVANSATNSVATIIEAAIRDTAYTVATAPPVFRSPRPETRPVSLGRISRRTDPAVTVRETKLASVAPTEISRRGTVCNDPRLTGEVLAPIRGKQAGCRIDDPVKITSVDGVALSQSAILNCRTARTLADWVRASLKPTLQRRGEVQSLRVAAHYSCRTRNNKTGAKLSEHAKGNAIDISAITLANGDVLTVEEGWKNYRDKRALKKLHATACGPFGTVLGPEADRFHRDHFHFDTARYRSGAYCK